MNTTEEKPQQFNGIAVVPSPVRDSQGENGAETELKSDTPLTHPRSGFDLEETRRQLIALRVKHGAETSIGHRCSNIIEMLKHGVPAASIAKQARALARLVNGPQ